VAEPGDGQDPGSQVDAQTICGRSIHASTDETGPTNLAQTASAERA